MTSKPKIAFYWCASCGGCEEAVVDLAEELLGVAEAVDIVFWPVALDPKRSDVEALEDGEILANYLGELGVDDIRGTTATFSSAEAVLQPHVPNQLLVKFTDEVAAADVNRAHAEVGGLMLRESPLTGVQLVEVADGADLAMVLDAYRAQGGVEYAEPNYIWQADRVPNDPNFAQLWGLDNTGQTGGNQRLQDRS